MDWVRPEILGISIPIIAILGALGTGVIKMFIDASERRFEMRLRMQQTAADSQNADIAALRREVAALRETSTQFDLALEEVQQRLGERVDRLEQRGASAPRHMSAAAEVPVQTVGRPD